MNIFNNKTKEKIDITELDYKALNNIKTLALDMINEAGSGHSGVVLSAGNILYTIYAKHLVFDKNNEKWINRDRFVLSAGHASALLYSMLHMVGYLSLDDLKNFRKLNSNTPGHPEVTTKGVETSTGPLGEGFANAVGMAIAEKYLNNRYKYNKKDSLIDHYTYCLCGDGDLMEGISYEAASVAGNLSLNKLIVLYDSNNNTSDNDTKETFKENVLERFKSQNWNTILINNTIEEIDNAIKEAKLSDKPTIIEVKTILGEHTKYQNSNEAHAKVLTKEEISKIKEKLNIRDIPFSISQDAFDYLNNLIDERNNKIIDIYNKNYEKLSSKIKKEYKEELNNLIENNYLIELNDIDIKEDLSQREISNEILKNIIKNNKLFLGGSCDLAKSTGTYLENNFTNNNLEGQNILFGIREHAVSAIINGITLSGLRSFTSTMLVFSDYMKPSIRMSALMNLPVTYIFSHDSILVGEDGATHQPVEQLVSLRSTPNLIVYRPYDINEIIGTYKNILKTNNPSVIITSKNKIKNSKLTKINEVEKGAYFIKENKESKAIIIATGYELELALNIEEKLEKDGIIIDVVSMPSIELFEKQKENYKEKILNKEKEIFVIEYSSLYSWYKYTKEENIFGIDKFGKSGNKDDIQKEYELDEESIYQKIKKSLS